jgi:hypothetical protein
MLDGKGRADISFPGLPVARKGDVSSTQLPPRGHSPIARMSTRLMELGPVSTPDSQELNGKGRARLGKERTRHHAGFCRLACRNEAANISTESGLGSARKGIDGRLGVGGPGPLWAIASTCAGRLGERTGEDSEKGRAWLGKEGNRPVYAVEDTPSWLGKEGIGR